MKKTIIILLTALLSLNMCSCGKNSGGGTVRSAFSAPDTDGSRTESSFSAEKISAEPSSAPSSDTSINSGDANNGGTYEQTQREDIFGTADETNGDVSENAEAENAPNGDLAAQPPVNGDAPQPEPEKSRNTCAFLIDCSRALESPDLPNKMRGVLPQNGIIFSGDIDISDGDSVFDILTRVTRSGGIPMEFSSSAGFGSKYVEGINSLYEFDCGPNSGWIYFVNGERPSVGCDKTIVKPGDDIRWYYTLDLGNDIDI